VIQWSKLALSKVPNRVGTSLPSPEDTNRPSFRNVVFSCCLECRTMGKIQKLNNSDYYKPSSEHFRICYWIFPKLESWYSPNILFAILRGFGVNLFLTSLSNQYVSSWIWNELCSWCYVGNPEREETKLELEHVSGFTNDLHAYFVFLLVLHRELETALPYVFSYTIIFGIHLSLI
jgi:hypothetical protein